ncbi:hypothetical protein HanXRQr2_Chr03g0132331 [Helianthus annuus]|uniref:Uncharacterized protein n=1 Tax=Helianthus annuus TaxID=4232 RepID=A0A9K3JK42_HELAN|nr:hypothetical protein HanXRQr2_Chr03g0132331 [Helianthus annuus]
MLLRCTYFAARATDEWTYVSAWSKMTGLLCLLVDHQSGKLMLCSDSCPLWFVAIYCFLNLSQPYGK